MRSEIGKGSLEALKRWCPSGAAEGEADILEQVFIQPEQITKIFSPPAGSPRILLGKKGSGKTAIFDYMTKQFKKLEIPSIKIRPMDIDTSQLGDNLSLGDLTREFTNVLVSAIAVELARNHSGLLKGDSARLYNEAIRSGKLQPDGLGKFARFLATVSKPITKADFANLFPENSKINYNYISSSVSNEIRSVFYLMIDDTDQVANPEKPAHLNRLWALILASRKICADVLQLVVVISLRVEIWNRLNTEASAQRDQTDHFSSLTIVLNSKPEQIAKIIDRRILCAAELKSGETPPYSKYFEGHAARAPQSEDFREWRELISRRVRQRPRDAVQLLHELADKSAEQKIDEATFRTVMPSFSEKIVGFFSQESEYECPQARQILDSFARIQSDDGGYRFKAETIRNHLQKLPSMFSINLYGKTLRPGDVQDAFALWRFLYFTDTLNARVSDARQPDGYNHVTSEENPNLVMLSAWPNMQKMLWEITPAFRDYLQMVASAEAASVGLPVRQKKSHRRKRF